MKNNIQRAIAAITTSFAFWIAPVFHAAEESPPPADPDWPREHISENKKLTV